LQLHCTTILTVDTTRFLQTSNRKSRFVGANVSMLLSVIIGALYSGLVVLCTD